MAANWSIPCGLAYGGEIPAVVDKEIRRLRKLIGEYCHGPYDESGIRIGIGFAVDGKNQFNPIKKGGVRLEPFRKNAVNAGIGVRQEDCDVPVEAFRFFIWKNAEKAIWACVERIKQGQVQVDESKIKHQLTLVQSEFLGSTANEGAELISLTETDSKFPDQHEGEEKQRLIIQYQSTESGNTDDHDKRVAVENLLHEFLEGTDLGYCDGGDIGSGTMNIFCFVKPGRDTTQAIIEILRKNNRLGSAVIAESVRGEEHVIWPPDFTGPFRLL